MSACLDARLPAPLVAKRGCEWRDVPSTYEAGGNIKRKGRGKTMYAPTKAQRNGVLAIIRRSCSSARPIQDLVVHVAKSTVRYQRPWEWS